MIRPSFGKLTTAALCLALGFTVACGDDSDDGGGAAGGGTGGGGTGGATATGGTGGGTAGGDGITPCGQFPDQIPKTCQAGQYCKDEGFSECVDGCLSQTNCTSAQTCEKAAGENAGTCQAVSTGVDCSAVCDKFRSCGESLTDAECTQFCGAFNDTCKQCILDANCTDENACANECNLN